MLWRLIVIDTEMKDIYLNVSHTKEKATKPKKKLADKQLQI